MNCLKMKCLNKIFKCKKQMQCEIRSWLKSLPIIFCVIPDSLLMLGRLHINILVSTYTTRYTMLCVTYECTVNSTIDNVFLFCSCLNLSMPMKKYQRILIKSDIISHIEAETNLPPFPRRNLHMHFCECNCIYFSKDFTEVFRKGPFSNIPALVQIMTWRRPGDKPLSESMMVSLFTHICVTWPQWI